MKRLQINDHVSRSSANSSKSNERSPQQAMLSMIALSFMVLFLMTVSCQPSRNGEAVDYGPEASNADLNKALISPIQDLDLNTLAVGQFVHFSTTDSFAGGQVTQVESDTGQTIVDRNDQPTITQFSVVQNKFTYGTSAPEKASIEFQLNIGREVAATPSPSPSPSATPQSSTTTTSLSDPTAVSATDLAPQVDLSQTPVDLNQRLEWLKNDPSAANSLRESLRAYATSRVNEARKKAGMKAASTDTPATIHRLHTWEAVEPAPDLVKAQPNCLGIPQCQIRVRHIQFDQVSWEKPGGSRVSFDLAMSPDVPLLSGYKMTPIFEYYPGLIKSCVTLLIPVGDKGSQTLLVQCNALENFAYTAAPQ